MKEKKALKCHRHSNFPHERNANFCVFCGSPLHNHPVCCQCGAKRDVRGPFCQNCGCPQKLTEELLEKAFKEDGVTALNPGRTRRA